MKSVIESFDLYRTDICSDGLYDTTRRSFLKRSLHFVALTALIGFPIVQIFTEPPPPAPRLSVDSSRERFFDLQISIDFAEVACQSLTLSFQASSGLGSPVDEQGTLKRRRLDPAGKVLGLFDPKTYQPSQASNVPDHVPLRERKEGENCGDCYGASATHCCDSCSDVLLAYRLKRWAQPMVEKIEQCADGKARAVEEEVPRVKQPVVASPGEEGCRIEGILKLRRVPGQLHLSSSEKRDRLTHKIRKFQVRGSPGELNQMVSEAEAGSHQYYITVVPYSFESDLRRSAHQKLFAKYFPVSEDPFHALVGHGVHFKFDFDPIHATYPSRSPLSLVAIVRALVDWLGFLGGFVSLLAVF
jgi:hypothetical protein